MKPIALTAAIVTGLALFAGYGSASNAGRWVMTDIDHAAQLAFPGYARRYLLSMTPGGRILWTAQPTDGSPAPLEIFQWQNGVVSDLGPLPEHMGLSDWNSGGAIVGTVGDPPYCGHVVITPAPCTPGPKHAYLWQPGKATALGTLGGKSSGTSAINDHGQITGWSETARGVRHAVLWQDGKIVDISPRGTIRGDATAINERGQVIEDAGFKKSWSGYLWRHGKLTKLGHSLEAMAINDRGQVTGFVPNRVAPPYRVVLWQNGRITDLVATEDPYGSAINVRGDVMLSRTFGTIHRGMLWRNGKLTDLGSLGGGWTFPAAINDRGQIVGTSTLPGSKEQDYHSAAFIWQDGKMTQLPESPDFLGATMAIDASGAHIVLGWPFLSCTAKSCAGQIVLWTYVP